MTETLRPMFPHVIDSTMLSAFRSCPIKMKYSYIEHWKPKLESVHLHAGAAFAKGLEETRKAFYIDGKDASTSEGLGLQALLIAYGDFIPITNTPKTLDRVAGAFEYFMSMYPLGADGFEPAKLPSGNRGIEFSFAEPLDILHPVTGDPILFAGRADMMGTYAGGFFIEDDKTTTSLGASWARAWEMRSQFTAYCWAAKKAGYNPQGALIRGVSILKTKYDTLEVVTYRGQWELDRWEAQTLRDIQRMIDSWESGIWDYSLDQACTDYGGCSFVDTCKSRYPENHLETDFEKRVWSPTDRREFTVAEWEASWEN